LPDQIIDINYNEIDAILKGGALSFGEGQFSIGGKSGKQKN